MDAAVLAELRRRYAEPHRVHHGWDRIAGMMAAAEEVVGGIADRTAFILAVLFHNAIFDPRRPDGAAQNAALMRDMVGASTPARTLARAEALIGALARQELPDTEDASLRGDAALLLDMDLAVLGSSPEHFDEFETAWRQEHAHLREDAYRAGRSAALQMLLWRERIYRTDRYYLALERRARANIERALARLSWA